MGSARVLPDAAMHPKLSPTSHAAQPLPSRAAARTGTHLRLQLRGLAIQPLLSLIKRLLVFSDPSKATLLGSTQLSLQLRCALLRGSRSRLRRAQLRRQALGGRGVPLGLRARLRQLSLRCRCGTRGCLVITSSRRRQLRVGVCELTQARLLLLHLLLQLAGVDALVGQSAVKLVHAGQQPAHLLPQRLGVAVGRQRRCCRRRCKDGGWGLAGGRVGGQAGGQVVDWVACRWGRHKLGGRGACRRRLLLQRRLLLLLELLQLWEGWVGSGNTGSAERWTERTMSSVVRRWPAAATAGRL